MSHDKWDENKIEELLSNFPKVKDTRSKEDILQRLKDDGVFDEEPSDTPKQQQPKKKKKYNWMPPLITIAAIALLAIMIPSLMNQMNHNNEEAAMSTSGTEEAAEMSLFNIEESENSANDQSNMSLMGDQRLGNGKTAVYPEDLEGYTLFTLGLESDMATSIPVTLLIPNEQIVEDLGKSNPSSVELYNYYAPRIDESALGFTDYHPYVGTITEEGNQVIHRIANNHPYDMSSATREIYDDSLIDTFPSYDEAVFLTEEGTPIIFDEEGMERKPLALQGETTHYSYFLIAQNDGSEYLAPNNRETFATVEEALDAMKIETNDIYKSVILPNIDYTTSVDGNTVTVQFTTQVDLMNEDQMDAMQMIEGMLLTAARFDMQVKFENIVQEQWGGFNFANPLPIPVGANKVPFILTQ